MTYAETPITPHRNPLKARGAPKLKTLSGSPSARQLVEAFQDGCPAHFCWLSVQGLGMFCLDCRGLGTRGLENITGSICRSSYRLETHYDCCYYSKYYCHHHYHFEQFMMLMMTMMGMITMMVSCYDYYES